ncbi:NADP-dependent oxidoreductase [Kribbia dieselivorans]|uniref:NADP-dependent oxidoreductase n=1 Tax=Kribbia dieselivorans TaxID=331526 RepID=UPI0008382E6D|nr:NADP-dependent oxidoreductase [Kribbia dieselivorans]
MTTSLEWHLVRRPHGEPTDDDFALVETPLPPLAAGQVRVRNTAFSVDPYMRGRMNDAKSYATPYELNAPMHGGAVGIVEEISDAVTDSAGREVHVGDTVLHGFGWRTTVQLSSTWVRVIDTDLAPASAYLGVLGMPGYTAYRGLLQVAEFAPGDTVFVSAAAGAVGSLVGQIARLKGAKRVIGSAGDPEKCAWLTDELGFDAAVDYRAQPIRKGLREAAPDGIDVYFDNVGGDHLEAAIHAMNDFGRAALCGSISGYNATAPTPGPGNLFMITTKRLTLRGFIVGDDESLRGQFEQEVGGWLRDGSIVARETSVAGIEQGIAAFRELMGGGNVGKMIVTL